MLDQLKLRSSYEEVSHDHVRGRDYIEFEINKELNYHELVNAILIRKFEIRPYTFVVKRPRPREVFACDCPSRVIQRYLGNDMIEYLDSLLSDSIYSNRKERGTLAAVEKSIEVVRVMTNNFKDTSEIWVIKLDVKGFFPNANRRLIYTKLKCLLVTYYKGDDLEELLYMLEVSILTSPTENCQIRASEKDRALIAPDKSLFNKPPGVGGAIGYLIWQICMNFYNQNVDTYIESLPDTELIRFVDDRLIITKNKDLVLNSIPRIRQLLAEEDMTLSEHKFYCQQVSKGYEFLGYHVKYDRKHLNKRIINRIRYCLRQYARKRYQSYENLETVFSTLNSYFGMFKHSRDQEIAQAIFDELDDYWKLFLTYNQKRMCLEFLPEYDYYHRLEIYSGFTFKKAESNEKKAKRKYKASKKLLIKHNIL